MAMFPGDNAPDVDERDIPRESPLYSLVALTKNSAFVDVMVNSPAGSGPAVYGDFGDAIRDEWYSGLEREYEGYDGKPPMGEDAPPKLRAGRRAFKALLERYDKEGYTPDMGDELTRLGSIYCPNYRAEVSAVLPNDLDKVLDRYYPDESEEDEADKTRTGLPPRAEFDLQNPQHIEAFQQYLEQIIVD